jgi:flagellar basal-body rod protein FlgF
MQNSLSVAISAQVSHLRQMETIANNIANLSTTGFRGDNIRFSSASVPAGDETISFAMSANSFVDVMSGPVEKTGSALDIAVQGAGYLSLLAPEGRVFTRDGRMSVSSNGALLSISGNAVLDASGAPIMLDANAGPPEISKDGMISQRGRQKGAIGLFRLDPASVISRRPGSSIASDRPPQAILDFATNGLLQGHLERSNVNGVEAMTHLISVQRSFENITSTIAMAENTLTDAIKTLGSPS